MPGTPVHHVETGLGASRRPKTARFQAMEEICPASSNTWTSRLDHAWGGGGVTVGAGAGAAAAAAVWAR